MRRLILLFLTVCTILSLLLLPVSAEVYSGKALDEDYIAGNTDEGEIARNYQIQYELDTKTGVLRIYCKEGYNPQKMLMYSKADWIPWYREPALRNSVRTAYIEEGVTTVGQYCFRECRRLEEIWLPSTVWRVDRLAISECASLKVIYYPGTKDDFETGVIWSNDHNDYTYNVRNTQTGELEPVTVEAKSLVHFGEHVRVICRTTDGYEFDNYTIGGYFAGDSYSFTPKTYEGLTLQGSAATVTGTFAEGDATEYVYTYACEHHYVHFDDKPCADCCEYCGKPSPYAAAHTWDTKVIQERGWFQSYQARQFCEVCGKVEDVSKPPLILPVGIGAGAGVGVLVILLIVVNIHASRKRKRAAAQKEKQ